MMDKIKEKVEELSEEEKTNLIIDLLKIAGYNKNDEQLKYLFNKNYRKVLLKQMGVE